MLFNNWINSYLVYVNDILDENGEISHNCILNRLNNKSNWITEFTIMKKAILKELVDIIKTENSTQKSVVNILRNYVLIKGNPYKFSILRNSTFIENKKDFCLQDDTRSRLHGQCMIMPVHNFDWVEFEERAHPLLWAHGHSSTSIISGKIVIYCLKKFLIPTLWPPSSFNICSLKYSIFVIFRVLINNDFITVYFYVMSITLLCRFVLCGAILISPPLQIVRSFSQILSCLFIICNNCF